MRRSTRRYFSKNQVRLIYGGIARPTLDRWDVPQRALRIQGRPYWSAEQLAKFDEDHAEV